VTGIIAIQFRDHDQEIAIDNLQYIDYSEYMITTKPKKELKTMTTNTVKRGRGKSAKAANLQIDFLKLAIDHFGDRSKFKNPEMLAFGRTQKQFKKGSWNWIFAPKYRVGRGEYQLPDLSAFTTFTAIIAAASAGIDGKGAWALVKKPVPKALKKPAPSPAKPLATAVETTRASRQASAVAHQRATEDEKIDKMTQKILMRLSRK